MAENENVHTISVNEKPVVKYMVVDETVFIKQLDQNILEDVLVLMICALEQKQFKYSAYLNI